MILKINFKRYIEEELQYYLKSNVEYGGFLFGEKKDGIIFIKSISVKKGSSRSITIEENDKNLALSKYALIGTWHTHLNFGDIILSNIDKKYYNKIDEKYIHFIFNKTGDFKVYNKNGKELKYEFIT